MCKLNTKMENKRTKLTSLTNRGERTKKNCRNRYPLPVEDIINGMNDWVRVLDLDCNIVYANKAMEDALMKPIVGKKCYEAFDKQEPCENCVSRKSIRDMKTYEKEETLDNKIFSVISSPVTNSDGRIIGAVEVLRDITVLKQMQKKIVRQNRELNNELDMAKKLQMSLLPTNLSEERVKYSFIYEPCRTLGGDFFDIFRINEDRIGVYIADVSGHGVSSSLLTVFLRSSINKNVLSPSEVLRQLYSEFNNVGLDPDLYITIFYSIINFSDLTITYSNAGHNISPIVFGKSRVEVLNKPGFPISSWVKNPCYTDDCLKLSKGEKVFYSSDGIVELRNSEKEQFGEERLLKVLLNDESEPKKTLRNIFTSACNFAGIESMEQIYDDITMAILELV